MGLQVSVTFVRVGLGTVRAIPGRRKLHMKKTLLSTLLVGAVGLSIVGWSWGTTPDREAYDLAKGLSVEKYRTHVLSIYGKGNTKDVQTWHINFFDPDSPSKGKVVVVQDGAVTRSHAAEWKSTYDDALSFDPTLSKVTAETAMKTAKAYADKNLIAYDTTRILLRRTEVGKAPFWRVELRQDGHSKGYVIAKSDDGTFASYEQPKKEGSGVQNLGKDIESTFKGIGADLEEFFTGERTVDK
jgi:hypothetical protein